jgi:hypothetical protein
MRRQLRAMDRARAARLAIPGEREKMEQEYRDFWDRLAAHELQRPNTSARISNLSAGE